MNNVEHLRSKPDRENFFADLAQLLGQGFTLIAADINSFMPAYGWAPNTDSANAILINHRATTALAAHDVKLIIDTFKGIKIYRDGFLAPSDTDIAKTHRTIENAQQASREQAQQTKQTGGLV